MVNVHSMLDSSTALLDSGQRIGALQCQLGTQGGAVACLKPSHAKVPQGAQTRQHLQLG